VILGASALILAFFALGAFLLRRIRLRHVA
jgi:hypothetical protein